MEIGQELWKSEKQGFGEGKNEGGLLIVPVFCFDVPLLSSFYILFFWFLSLILYYSKFKLFLPFIYLSI